MKQYMRPQMTAFAETVFGVRSGKGASNCKTNCTSGGIKE